MLLKSRVETKQTGKRISRYQLFKRLLQFSFASHMKKNRKQQQEWIKHCCIPTNPALQMAAERNYTKEDTLAYIYVSMKYAFSKKAFVV